MSRKPRSDTSGNKLERGTRRLGSQAVLDRKIQSRLGQHLRALHDELVSQPIPDHLLDLIRQLDARASAGGAEKPDEPGSAPPPPKPEPK